MDLLDRLLEHGQWATAQLLEFSRDLTDEQLDRQFDIGHETLRATFEHMVFNIQGWTAAMAGSPPSYRPDDGSLAALIKHHERVFGEFAELARRTRDEQRLNESFEDNYGEQMSFGSAILHVILHDSEHRSEVLHILKRLGMEELPEIDLALWDLTVRAK